MTGYNFLILCILLGTLSLRAAAPGELRGLVTDGETGEPIRGVVVQTKGSFTSTDADGKFSIRLKSPSDSVSFRCMGYEGIRLPASYDFSRVVLTPKATRLKDVIVKAPDIYAKGDTLVFNVGQFAKPEDNAIIDVIKRLPGVRVKDDGTIEYQGKPINRFYLDGNDFIGGQYGLATNNISHKDVASVEDMENHQPVKALEGIEFPEEAGINLKLKEDARSRWVGVAQGAVGVQPMLYDGSLFAMRMGRTMQNMFTLKADNTGWNPATQITEHDFNDMFSGDYVESLWPEYISADIVNAPLTEKRTRDNLSWLANGITAWKRGDTSMHMKFNYMGDRLDYNSNVVTDYFSESIPTFIQNNNLDTRVHDLSAQFNATINKRDYFLKDKLMLKSLWDDSNSVVTGSYDIKQKVARKELSVANDLKLVKRTDRKLFNLTSRNSLSYNPNNLGVSGEFDAVQKMDAIDFRSTTETQFGRMTRFWKYYLTAGIDLNYHNINASLSGLEKIPNKGMYNALLSDIYATPQIDFVRNGWRLSLLFTAKWLHTSLCENHDYINIKPRLSVNYRLTSKSELSGYGAYRLYSPGAYMHMPLPVMSDYRNIFIAANPHGYSQSVAANVSYRYRNPLKAVFFNASVTYNHDRSPIMTSQLFIEDFIVTTSCRRLSKSESWFLKGGFSKGFKRGSIVVGCVVGGSTTSSSSMRDNEVVPFHLLSFNAKPYVKGSLLKWLSVNYEADYSFSRMKVEDNGSTYHTFRQNIFATVIPLDALQFTAGAEYYFTRFAEGNTANLFLIDASAVWHVNGKIRLSLTANNLLNRHRYEYVNYGTLSRSEYSFSLRPRSILASIQYRF